MAPDIMPLELSTAIQEIQSICDAPNSRSEYFEYGSSGYKDSIRHFLASSSEVAQLAVQPGSVKDLCSIMNVLREHPTVQFAVKSGGHGMAPGLSSTTGIHISMTRFSKISYDADSQLAEIGSGCLWDQVYSQLASTGRNVVGGASSDGVGVGGSLLGGGYSLKSNRYGLGIDNIVAIEIVTPDGRARRVSLQREPDLFQALRGGGNNFGIVTKFTVRTFAQNPTYGAYFLIMGSRAEAFKKAMVEYVENEERQEACVVAAFRHELVRGKADPEYTISIFCVYDAEKPKKRSNVPFQEFSRLQKSGDVWKADPAGWQLGKTQLSISDGSLKHRTPQSTSHNHKTAPHRPHQRRNGAGHHHEDDSDNESIFSSAFEEMSFNRFYNVSSRPPAASNDRSTAYDSDEYSLTSSRGSPVTYDDTDDLDSSDGADQLSDSDDPPPEYSSNLDDSDDDRSSPPRPASNYRSKRHKDEDSDSEDGYDSYGRGYGRSQSRNQGHGHRHEHRGHGHHEHDAHGRNQRHHEHPVHGHREHTYRSHSRHERHSGGSNKHRGKYHEESRGPGGFSLDDASDSEDDDADDPFGSRRVRVSRKGGGREKDSQDFFVQQRVMVTKKIDKMGELNERGRFGCLMISKYTKPLLDKMQEEAEKAASYLKTKRGLSVIVDAWPVHPAIFDNSPPGAAFPHERGQPYGPMLAYFRWENEADDEFWLTKLKGTLNRIRVVARELGLTSTRPALYNNLSLEDVSSEKIYRKNLEWLQKVKKRYDPSDVMGRCGAPGHNIALPTRTSSNTKR